MTQQRVGLMHPGMMGITVGAAAQAGGAQVSWASENRSAQSHERAGAAGLTDIGATGDLIKSSDIILSVCPPHAAGNLARNVVGAGFTGTFVDANAVTPATARSIAALCADSGARFVDGGIIGPPAHNPGTTRLYLSGDGAREVATLFEGSALEAIPIDGPTGAASALKMCYAANTKGMSALLIAIRALATAEGVDDALLEEWSRSQPQLGARSEAAAMGTAPKAWRFVGEMQEIADSFAAAGLPDGFHRAAAELYARMERHKNRQDTAPLQDVIRDVLDSKPAD